MKRAMALRAASVGIAATLAACGTGTDQMSFKAGRSGFAAVPKAKCGPLDRTETGLQGQTPLADRQSGATAQAYNCNWRRSASSKAKARAGS